MSPRSWAKKHPLQCPWSSLCRRWYLNPWHPVKKTAPSLASFFSKQSIWAFALFFFSKCTVENSFSVFVGMKVLLLSIFLKLPYYLPFYHAGSTQRSPGGQFILSWRARGIRKVISSSKKICHGKAFLRALYNREGNQQVFVPDHWGGGHVIQAQVLHSSGWKSTFMVGKQRA